MFLQLISDCTESQSPSNSKNCRMHHCIIMLFGASFLSDSAFRKLLIAGSRDEVQTWQVDVSCLNGYFFVLEVDEEIQQKRASPLALISSVWPKEKKKMPVHAIIPHYLLQVEHPPCTEAVERKSSLKVAAAG